MCAQPATLCVYMCRPGEHERLHGNEQQRGAYAAAAAAGMCIAVAFMAAKVRALTHTHMHMHMHTHAHIHITHRPKSNAKINQMSPM